MVPQMFWYIFHGNSQFNYLCYTCRVLQRTAISTNIKVCYVLCFIFLIYSYYGMMSEGI